ncbi:helix-turn-helix transcriptional regulator [Ruminococcus sp.]|uniref:helix-turn-helix domain-containing protein n=1 Tax=Ruminococcus sp. TaxID=41978 RepID=UPI0025CD1B0A|nr:helix-turn-helix transcriptional regulator [Ruminococcus sp.]MBR1430174.1 helix-turn-helix transcriptional regulator [Ruminococcus sp.]
MFDENVSPRERVIFGDRMLYLRQSLNMTHSDFAKKLCRQESAIIAVEQGEKSWSCSMIKLISYVFGVSYQWLVFGKATDDDPDFLKEYKSITYSTIATEELIYKDFLESGRFDTFNDDTEAKKEHLENKFERLAPFCEASLLADKLDDYGIACFEDGFDKGYKYAVAFVRGMLGLEGIPDKPDASTVIITKKRK